MLDKKAWGADGMPAHYKVVQWGCGQGSVQAKVIVMLKQGWGPYMMILAASILPFCR